MFLASIAVTDWLEDLMELIRLRELLESIGLSILVFALIAAIVILLEVRSGVPESKYKSKAFFRKSSGYPVGFGSGVYLQPKCIQKLRSLTASACLTSSILAFLFDIMDIYSLPYFLIRPSFSSFPFVKLSQFD